MIILEDDLLFMFVLFFLILFFPWVRWKACLVELKLTKLLTLTRVMMINTSRCNCVKTNPEYLPCNISLPGQRLLNYNSFSQDQQVWKVKILYFQLPAIFLILSPINIPKQTASWFKQLKSGCKKAFCKVGTSFLKYSQY